jgi:hypothetical protein
MLLSAGMQETDFTNPSVGSTPSIHAQEDLLSRLPGRST